MCHRRILNLLRCDSSISFFDLSAKGLGFLRKIVADRTIKTLNYFLCSTLKFNVRDLVQKNNCIFKYFI